MNEDIVKLKSNGITINRPTLVYECEIINLDGSKLTEEQINEIISIFEKDV